MPNLPLSEIAKLMGDASRAAILTSLMGGRQLPASDLARAAHISRATTSEHLAKLMDGGLVQVRPHGRYRYYRLASTDVARAIESIMRIAPPETVKSLSVSIRNAQLRLARTCYDHLAGTLGIAISDAFTNNGWLSLDYDSETFTLTSAGVEQLTARGITKNPQKHAPLVRACLDWSERRYHIAGQVGSALTQWFFDCAWITRGASPRTIVVTELGRRELKEHFKVDWPPTLIGALSQSREGLSQTTP